MKKIILLAALFIFNPFFSQVSHKIHLTGTDFPYERIDDSWFTNKIKNKYTSLGEREEIIDDYIYCLLKNKEYYFKSDLEYTDWPEANAYLQKIFFELYKNENIKPGDVRIQLVRDPELNAFAQEDGTIYMHVGMLATFNSEAQIASVFGHEWGHVALNHAFHNYKSHLNYKRNTSIGNGLGMIGFGIAGLIVNKISKKSYEGNLISSEVEADNNALLSSKKSMYSNKAGAEPMKYFFRAEEKEKSKVNYRNVRNYIHDHPSTQKRIDFFEKNSEVDSSYKKNFLIDSTYFFKLKQQAIDETIYLFFKQQNFDDCIELSFAQYLDCPKDNFYLFFLIESIRRSIAINNTLADKRFITSNYILEPKKVIKPLAINSTKYNINTISDFIYQYSIFYRLKEILFLDNPEKLRNKKLTDTDTLEFITYADALLFFNSEASAAQCRSCRISEILNGQPVKPDTIAQNNIEEYYLKLSKIHNSYLTNKPLEPQKDLIILSDYNVYKAISFKTEEDDEYITKFEIYGKENYPNKYETASNLNLSEYNNINNFYSGVNKSLPRSSAESPYKGTITKTYDCKMILPEITEILYKHNYNRVFYVSIAKYDYGTRRKDFCLVTMIDFKNNKIAKTGVKIGSLSSSTAAEKAYEIIAELNKH